jgi:hypothetical protein
MSDAAIQRLRQFLNRNVTHFDPVPEDCIEGDQESGGDAATRDRFLQEHAAEAQERSESVPTHAAA